MEPQRAIEVIADACQALNFSHQHGIIHRDVKPANIMISKTGAVKVMDFGIARALADTGNPMTQTAAVIGTAQYLSPEQARGEKVDARSDVYSLGCVLYEMLTGEPPFVGDSPVAVAYQHVREDPVAPSQRHTGISPDLDAVVLKALAKNPENRYQTAAEMRTDLIRVHSGEAPDAPKVFTDAERTSLLSAPPPSRGRAQPTEHIPTHQAGYVEPQRGGSIGKWLIAVAVLAVLTVVVTLAINMIGGSPRDQQVPDVAGQGELDATAALQNRGFKTHIQRTPDSKVSPGNVINTDPAANSTVAAGDDITINVSTGPEQRVVPDVKGLSAVQAAAKLKAAGFEKTTESLSVSAPEAKDQVLATVPPANSTSAITNVITIVVGKGPDTKTVPEVKGGSADDATKILVANGFTTPPIQIQVDGLRSTAGQVVGTVPAAGEMAPVDTPIQIQVSRGNQFAMPDLRKLFWDDAAPLLQSLGWQNIGSNFVKLPNAQNSGVPSNGVVYQDPPAGTPMKPTDTITLSFAQ
jgi:serine/threonine-protein kinase